MSNFHNKQNARGMEHIAQAIIDAIQRGAGQARIRGIEAEEQQRQSILRSLRINGHHGEFDGDDLVVMIDIKNRQKDA